MNITDLDEYTTVKWRLTEECNYKCPYCIRRPMATGIKTDRDRLMREAEFISKIETDRPVKIDMIGGEVSTIPFLKDIYEVLRGKVSRVQITTNLSQPAEYYNELNEIIETSLMASWHKCGQTLDAFMKKAKRLKVANLTLEMVSTERNQADVDKFIEATKGFNIMVDVDRNSERSNSLKHTTNKKRARYDFNGRLFYSKPELLSFLGNGRYIDTYGLTCDWTHYAYVENSIFAVPSDKPGECCDHLPIEGHSINEALRKKVCSLRGCTLCGHMSLSS